MQSQWRNKGCIGLGFWSWLYYQNTCLGADTGCELSIFLYLQPQKLPDPMGEISSERRKMIFGFFPSILFPFLCHFCFSVLLSISPVDTHRCTSDTTHTSHTHRHPIHTQRYHTSCCTDMHTLHQVHTHTHTHIKCIHHLHTHVHTHE